MRGLLCLLLSLPGSTWAWEILDPGRPLTGAVTTTTITDILAVNGADWGADGVWRDGYWIAFADADVVEVCRTLGGGPNVLSPDSPNPHVAAAFTYAGRYVYLEPKAQGQHLLPVALFAQAHGMRVRVKLRFYQERCVVDWLQTCTGPTSCRAP